MPSLFSLILLTFVLHVQGSSNRSFEHALRSDLLTNYDKKVFPKLGGGELIVNFGMKINKLIKVDNKEQHLTLDTWIVMEWNNTFLEWNATQYGGTDDVQFLPSEIWFPDIQLYNNGDLDIVRAGGREKFISDVRVQSSGRCIWSGPAKFVVNCEMELGSYPFDHQSCEMRFGSYNFAGRKLHLRAFKTKDQKGDRYVESGDWKLTKVTTSTGLADHGNCCPYKFSEISYNIEITRRFQYHIFYLVAPCVLLAGLALFSFFIPTESGERIGFVTTVLLGMMVFLLIIPESLPESSKSIPILGILMMSTTIVIALILFVTIFIIKCFYSSRRAPAFLRKKFGNSGNRGGRVGQTPSSGTLDIVNINLQAVNHGQSKDLRSVSREVIVEKDENDNEVVWQGFSRLCDKIMFILFLITTVVMFTVVLLNRD